MERPWQWPGQGRPRVLTSSVGRCGQMICRGSASSFYVLKDIYFHHYSFFCIFANTGAGAFKRLHSSPVNEAE